MGRINPKRLWRDIQETADVGARRERAREAKLRADQALAELRKEEEHTESDLAALAAHPGNEPGARPEIRRLRRLAFLLLVADVPVQFLLNRAAFPHLPDWVAAATALPVALAIGLFAHGGAMLVLYDKKRPARSIRQTAWLARASFVAAVLAVTVFIFARQATEGMAGYLFTMTALSLWVLAESLPVAAGFTSAWARMLAHPTRQAERLRALQAEIGSWEALRERLATVLPPEEMEAPERAEKAGQGELFRPLEPRTVGRSAALGLAFLLAAGVLFSEPAHAQGPERVCAVMADRTLSVDVEHRARAMGLLREALPELPALFGCRELLVGHFADEGPWAPRRALAVPVRAAPADCDDAALPAHEGATGLVANMRGFREHLQKEAREACRKEEEARLTRHGAEERAFVAGAWEILSAPQLDRVTRTDLVGVVGSLLEGGVHLSLLVTDGIDTVTRRPKRLALAPGQRVVLILVPAREAYGGRASTEQAARAWEEAGARTVPYTTLVSPAGWLRVDREVGGE